MLDSLIMFYAAVKKSRRLLRAKCRLSVGAVHGKEGLEMSRVAYEDQMGSLNDTQLALEILVQDLTTFPHVFATTSEIRKAVGKMENCPAAAGSLGQPHTAGRLRLGLPIRAAAGSLFGS